jgi:hypothetical protein
LPLGWVKNRLWRRFQCGGGDLLADHDPAGIVVDGVFEEPHCLTAAQTAVQDQDVERVEQRVVRLGVVEERTILRRGPHHHRAGPGAVELPAPHRALGPDPGLRPFPGRQLLAPVWAGQPEVASRCCSSSWAACSTSLCRHSAAR